MHEHAARESTEVIAAFEHRDYTPAAVFSRQLDQSGGDPAVVFLDQLEHFMSKMKDDEREILELRLQGYSSEEIAKKLDTYDRKVRRVLERIRSLAEQELQLDIPESK